MRVRALDEARSAWPFFFSCSRRAALLSFFFRGCGIGYGGIITRFRPRDYCGRWY